MTGIRLELDANAPQKLRVVEPFAACHSPVGFDDPSGASMHDAIKALAKAAVRALTKADLSALVAHAFPDPCDPD
jgi:hypothetical protein